MHLVFEMQDTEALAELCIKSGGDWIKLCLLFKTLGKLELFYTNNHMNIQQICTLWQDGSVFSYFLWEAIIITPL